MTPPAGYEVSLSSGSSYSTSLSVPYTGAALAGTTVHVRLAATTAVGAYAGDITVSGGGATSKTIATASSKVISVFDNWAGKYGLTGANALMGADPDKDGQNNLLEFALGGGPNSGADNAKVYVLTQTAPPDYTANKVLILTIAARADTNFGAGGNLGVAPSAIKDGVKYTIEGGTTLGFGGSIWYLATPVTTGLPEDPPAGYQYLSFVLYGSENLPGKGFMRVKVEQE